MVQRAIRNVTEEQMKILKEILENHEREHGNIISLLQDVQEKYGYLPKEILKELSIKLKLPLSEIYGIATFYAQFTFNPKGKFAITVCDGTACHVQNSPLLREFLEINLKIKSGETSDNGDFSLESVACIGCCAIAPAMIVNEEVHGNMTLKKVSKLLTKLKKQAAEV